MLFIDGDGELLERAARLFRTAGHGVVTADTGVSGMSTSADYAPHAVIVNLRLPDMSGLKVVRAVRRTRPASCIVVTVVARCRHAMKAIRSGADYCVEDAADSRLLLRMLNKTLVTADNDVVASVVAHSLRRWAEVVVRSIDSPTDFRTLQEWGRFVGVSVGGLRNWCLTAHLPARQSLLLARVLRAVMRQQDTDLTPNELLNIVDRRSLEKLLVRSGGARDTLPPSPEAFLQRQQLIGHPKAVATLRAALDCRTQ